MMNLFYRGYVIHEDVRAVCYTIYDRRPNRTELVIAGDSGEAMTWVDQRLAAAQTEATTDTGDEINPWLSWMDEGRAKVSAW